MRVTPSPMEWTRPALAPEMTVRIARTVCLAIAGSAVEIVASVVRVLGSSSGQSVCAGRTLDPRGGLGGPFGRALMGPCACHASPTVPLGPLDGPYRRR